MPGYWMHETGGQLRPAIEALLWGGQLTNDQVPIVRDYLRQWIAGPWIPEEPVQCLRDRIDGLACTGDILSWLEDADAIGIDPL